MAVRTDYVALGHLAEHGFPVPVTKAATYGERLVGEVIELEHDRTCLAAVRTGVIGEKLEEEDHPGSDDGLLPRTDVVDVALAVGGVMFLLVEAPARAAEVVTLTFLLPAPGEGFRQLHLAAPATPSKHR
jgi:hypothetical protein